MRCHLAATCLQWKCIHALGSCPGVGGERFLPCLLYGFLLNALCLVLLQILRLHENLDFNLRCQLDLMLVGG